MRGISGAPLAVHRPHPVETAFFIGADGLAYLAAYEMEQQVDGSWRIAGVQMIRAVAESA